MTHFFLECYGGRGKRARITEYPKLKPPLDGWMKGKRWDVEVPDPLVFKIDGENEGEMMPIFKTHFLLMRDDVIDTIKEVAVDGLDCYESIIRETESGKEHTNYKCVNITRLVKAVDMSKSEIRSLGCAKEDLYPRDFAGSFSTRARSKAICCSGWLKTSVQSSFMKT